MQFVDQSTMLKPNEELPIFKPNEQFPILSQAPVCVEYQSFFTTELMNSLAESMLCSGKKLAFSGVTAHCSYYCFPRVKATTGQAHGTRDQRQSRLDVPSDPLV